MGKFFESFIPTSATPLVQARAKVLVATCFAIGAGTLALLLYWIVFSWLEELLTVGIGLVLILIVAGIVALVKQGRVRAAAWALTILMALLTLTDIVEYGVGGTTATGFLIPIALAAFTLGPRLGMGTAILGSVAAFAIALAGAAGALHTEIPFQESNLSFDAMALTLIYLLVGMICMVWTRAANDAFGKLVE
jgi:hypothetical protein